MVGSRIEHEEWIIEVDPQGVGEGPTGTDLIRIGFTPVEPDPDGREVPMWTDGHSLDELGSLHAALTAYLKLERIRWSER